MALGNPLLVPFSQPLTDNNRMLTAFWLAWFNQLYQTIYKNLQIAQGIPSQSATAITQIEPNPGDIVFNSTSQVWQGWNGSAWVTFTTS